MPSFRIVSNHVAVIKSLDDFKGHIKPLAVTITNYAAETTATRAKEYAHVGPDPTRPSGREHTRDTIAIQPLNQYASRVLAQHGAPWEERRGGDHAFLSRAVAETEPKALVRFEQIGLEVVNSL